MINDNDINTFENYERKITQLITQNTLNLKNEDRKTQIENNAKDILSLCDNASLKFYGVKKGIKLSTEYINFLIRFYEHKTEKQAYNYIARFLKALDLKFKSLKISKVNRKYKKLIKHRYKDFIGFKNEIDVLSHFENTNPISYILTNGFKELHFIN